MRTSDQPGKLLKAFAVDGTKNDIPTNATTATQSSGAAALSSGFPDITMQSRSSGGVPPDGKDMNGILYLISAISRWQGSGMGFTFDSALSQEIAGYAKGAMLLNSNFDGFWKNTVDNNTNSPEASNATSTGWVPDSVVGLSIVIPPSSSTQLSSLQASRPRISVEGTITSNVNVILPAWLYTWTVTNNTTGGFSVIFKTPSGTGVEVAPGKTYKIYGNGTNIEKESGTVAYQDTVPVSMGGTGSTTAAGARTALGLGSASTENIVPVSKGGTGASDAAGARTSISVYSKAESDNNFSPRIPAYLSVGSYVLALNSGGDITPGTSVSGSLLRAATADGFTSGGTLPGTWRCHGFSETTNDSHRTSLFLRIS